MPPVDLSLIGIFLNASSPVQAVLGLLVICSVLCWAIILDKAVTLVRLSREARGLEMGRPCSPLAAAILAAAREEAAARPHGTEEDVRNRMERVMRETMISALMRAEARLPYLATIGSSAPFIGLFGTVWGIMHAFANIARANDTALAVVAPGIAEALSTTAIGLAAAIPASIAYNKLAADFGALARRLSLAIARQARTMER